MRIISSSFGIISMPEYKDALRIIERAARLCYKSESSISSDSAQPLIRRLIKSGHHSVLEHVCISVKITCDRGVSHELVRHRLASYSQTSTRYCNYSKEKFGNEITVIRPCFWKCGDKAYKLWKESMLQAETTYMSLIKAGATAQEARSVLPNSLATEIMVTANIREWRHILELRCSKKAHPQIREIMKRLLAYLWSNMPVFFRDVYDKYYSIPW